MGALVPGGNSRPFTRRGPALLRAVFLGLLVRRDDGAFAGLEGLACRFFATGWATFEGAGFVRAVAARVRSCRSFLGVTALPASPVSGVAALAISLIGVCIDFVIWVILLLARYLTASPHERSGCCGKQVGSWERWRRNGDYRFKPQSRNVWGDRKSTRLNSSHQIISYAVFCLKKKKK